MGRQDTDAWQKVRPDYLWYPLNPQALRKDSAGAFSAREAARFRAEVVITEWRENGEGGLSSLAGQLTGLHSLAAINVLGFDGSGKEARAVLQSRHLIEEFIRRNDLLLKILPDRSVPPVMWFAVNRFQEEVLGIREDSRRGTVTVAIEWPDPAVAARWTNAFIALANDSLRLRAIEESKRRTVPLP